MRGEQIRRLRERLNLSRVELADLLNGALGKSYSGATIGRWEREGDDGHTSPPAKAVQAFLDELAVGDLTAVEPPDGDRIQPGADEPLVPADERMDTPPGPPGGGFGVQPRLTSVDSVWTKACQELWELIATGVGMVGAATGSEALVLDGAIIAGDTEALGAAWGKLAETNETFRKMLVGMTEGGAWLQVALVTGTTVSKCYQSHAELALQRQLLDDHGEQADEPLAA